MSGTKNKRVVAGNRVLHRTHLTRWKSRSLVPHAFFYFALRIFFLKLCVLRRQCSSATLSGSWAPVSKRFYISFDPILKKQRWIKPIKDSLSSAVTRVQYTRVLAQLLIRFDGYIIHFLPTRRRRRRRIVSLRWGVLYRVLSQWKLRQERTRV